MAGFLTGDRANRAVVTGSNRILVAVSVCAVVLLGCADGQGSSLPDGTSAPGFLDVVEQAQLELFDSIPAPGEINNTRNRARDAAIDDWETAPADWLNEWCSVFDRLGHQEFMGWLANLFYEDGVLNEIDATFASEYIESFADTTQERCAAR